MDDLKMLRDLGARLEHQPPPELARQRHRLLLATARRRRVGWLMTGLAAAATATAVAVPTVMLSGHETVTAPSSRRPANVTGALNVLVVGTDSLAGPARHRNEARTDTILLVHLPRDSEEVTFVNLPRDSMVEIPSCGSRPARRGVISSAFADGGLTCTAKTVETLTDVRIDHMVEFDFNGFKEVVDALGGVEVTLREPVKDAKAKLSLPAGTSRLDGEQALGYARLRDRGDGADVQRIKRQWGLVHTMLEKAKKELTDPGRLRAFLATATKSIKTDEGLDLEMMAGIAEGMRKSRPAFVTVPWRPAPDNPDRVVWKEPDATRLFASLR